MRLGTTISAAFLVTTTSVAVAVSACGGGGQQPAQNATTTTASSSAPASTDTSSAATTSSAPAATDTSTSTAPTASGSTAGGPPQPWDSMSHDAKLAYMKDVVMPAMRAEFQTFDGTKYATFTCKTCHGSGAKDGTFKMPNADLPKLDLAHGFAKDKAAHPTTMDFMMQKVKPDMAKLLGEAEYSQTNTNGFGCMECHTAAP
jgi:hypothetical protein